jgi:chromate transporter
MDNDGQQMTGTAIFTRFLRFGLLAWGGPVAQIAMVKRELIDEEKWLTPSRFGRLLAIYQVLPGPEAHELCVHLGVMKGGRLGGLLAGLGFMLPGLLLMLLLSWGYTRLDLDRPLIAALFLGVQVGVIALIFRAVHRIGEHILTDRWLWGIALTAFAGAALDVHFLILLPAAGAAYALARAGRLWATGAVVLAAVLAAWASHDPRAITDAATMARASGDVSVWLLFLAGLKAGLLTFGGAYTAIPFVRDDTVGRGWIGDGQFLDGLALSGIIPAPLIIFATFVGYLAGGLAGALAMTAGIFVPAFAFSMLFYDRLERVVEDQRLHHFLEGVAAGVVAMIAMTLVDLFQGVAGSVPSQAVAAAIFIGALAVLYLWKSKLNVLAVVAGSALIGMAAFG